MYVMFVSAMHRGARHANHSFQLGTNLGNVRSTWV